VAQVVGANYPQKSFSELTVHHVRPKPNHSIYNLSRWQVIGELLCLFATHERDDNVRRLKTSTLRQHLEDDYENQKPHYQSFAAFKRAHYAKNSKLPPGVKRLTMNMARIFVGSRCSAQLVCLILFTAKTTKAIIVTPEVSPLILFPYFIQTPSHI